MASTDPTHLLEVGAYWKHKIVLTAIRLGIFTLLASDPMTAKEVAFQLKGSQRAFTIFCAALTSLGLLVKNGDYFSNSSIAHERLVRHSEGYTGDQLVLDDVYWGLWGSLEQALLEGTSPLENPLFYADSRNTERLITGLHRDALAIAPRVVQLTPLDNPQSLLDLGGGAGTYAIAFCDRYPELKATIFDLPTTTKVTRRIVRATGAAGRITVVDGNFLTDALAGEYDAVVMSNVLHGQQEQQNIDLFRKVIAATAPGGTLVIRDVLMNETLVAPAWGAVFAVNMLLHTGIGRCYSVEEVSTWLAGVGFTDIREVQRNELLIARKPAP